MIKIGIIGAQNKMAGELIRILINHPEAEIVTLYAPGLPGRSIASVHHGFIGESPLLFSDKFNIDNLDLVFIIDSSFERNIIQEAEKHSDLKLISLSQDNPDSFSIGLSEINRKNLVRNSHAAVIPHPAVVSALIPLIPLGKFKLLNSDISIEVTLSPDLVDTSDIKQLEKLISRQLVDTQPGFTQKVELKLIPSPESERVVETKITMVSTLPLEEVENIYEQIYDDHNFTFLTSNELSGKEVEGTQKNLIQISKPDTQTLLIKTVADSRFRGGAGDAVHVMNLFFGLHEKTGLSQKPSRY